MFLGEFHTRIDKRRRLSIPPSFCDHLGDSVVITRGLDRCLLFCPRQAWEELFAGLGNEPIAQHNTRRIARVLFSSAQEARLDNDDRLTLPRSLCEYANIAGRVVIAGVNRYAEIWSEKEWQEEKLHHQELALIGETVEVKAKHQ